MNSAKYNCYQDDEKVKRDKENLERILAVRPEWEQVLWFETSKEKQAHYKKWSER